MSAVSWPTGHSRVTRRLVLHFCTSNIEDKYLQARLVLGKRGFEVHQFKTLREPYTENDEGSSRQLLHEAIREVRESVGRTSLFFVEDTSLRIEALSTEDDDFPGLRVKHWFSETDFSTLDSQLASGSRSATIKSDIGLHVPGLDCPVLFHGEVTGVVAERPPAFGPNPQYPWLRPDTFNGWFIPDGESQRLGEMDLERSLPIDFRSRALNSLADRLEEYRAAANLPPQSVSLSTELKPRRSQKLFGPGPCFVVIGNMCAGKTTLGENAAIRHGFRHVEASDELKRLSETPIGTSDETKYLFAQESLAEHGPDIVARLIVDRLGSDLEEPTIITGFRAIEEVGHFRDRVPWSTVVHIQADERLRYERHIRRGRSEKVGLQDFKRIDQLQESFGLLPVARDICDIEIVNEASLDSFLQQVDFVLAPPSTGSSWPGVHQGRSPRHGPESNRLFRLLKALSDAGRPMTTEELEAASRASGRAIRHNNANKVLKAHPSLATRIDSPSGSRLRYAVRPAGQAYLRAMVGKYKGDGST